MPLTHKVDLRAAPFLGVNLDHPYRYQPSLTMMLPYFIGAPASDLDPVGVVATIFRLLKEGIDAIFFFAGSSQFCQFLCLQLCAEWW